MSDLQAQHRLSLTFLRGGMLARRGFSRCSNLHRDQHRGGPDLSRENPRIGERAGTAAQLGIVHVLSHSRHRQYVVTVTIVARVSTALPWQKGQMAGRAQPSAERESGIVIVSSATRVERGEFDGVSEQEGDRQQHLRCGHSVPQCRPWMRVLLLMRCVRRTSYATHRS